LPSHHGHEARSLPLVDALCDRLLVPNRCRELALLVAELHGKAHRALDLRANTMLKLLEQTDAFRRAERFDDFVTACEADARGRLGLEAQPYPQAQYLRGARQAAAAVNARDFIKPDMSGDKIAQQLHSNRVKAIRHFYKHSALQNET